MQDAGVDQPTANKSKDNEGFVSKTMAFFVALGVLVFLLLIIWAITPRWIKYPLLYASRYQVDPRHVHPSKMPSDCDWGHAPIGDKACHYERHAITTKNRLGHVAEVDVVWDKIQE